MISSQVGTEARLRRLLGRGAGLAAGWPTKASCSDSATDEIGSTSCWAAGWLSSGVLISGASGSA